MIPYTHITDLAEEAQPPEKGTVGMRSLTCSIMPNHRTGFLWSNWTDALNPQNWNT